MAQLGVYLGGPEVFLPNADAVLAAKAQLAAEYGFLAVMPKDRHGLGSLPPDPIGIARAIYAADVAALESADFGIFNLTPFRGVSADVGTVFELGMMTGRGKPSFAYTNVTAAYADRFWLKQHIGPKPTDPWVDERGWHIENFGDVDNLMLGGAVAATGREVVRNAAPISQLLDNLDGFKGCLALASQHFRPGPG